MRRTHVRRFLCAALTAVVFSFSPLPARAGEPAAVSPADRQRLVAQLDAPLLFVKRHSYTGIHIYDTYYKWPPGGGGIYVLENPAAPRAAWKIRPIIDPTTPTSLGLGVYTHPELSYDARRLLFCFKGEPTGSTSIYEIGVDGQGLRRVTNPEPLCNCHKGSGGGLHDIAPVYLPDGRIAFLSTRPSGLVPCANSGVSTLHVMNADGSDIHPISVNNLHEFDPAILPDGRILFGRWEYVDKNALTIQSLWTINPDGAQETALFANNMVFPEAVLDARPIPDSRLIVATLAKHNSTPRGSIALVDPRVGKNAPQAIINLEHPDDPTFDRGDSCEPWPLSDEAFVFSGRPAGSKRNVLEMIDRRGTRFVLLEDPEICLHAPMLIKPRPMPASVADTVDRRATTGRFFVQDVYRGLDGVRRGDVKWLRVIEETSRVSASPGGKQPYNQTFLVSAALAFSVKNFLGVVPVEADGSAYFEVPAGRALYLQALDGDGRLVQSMRTFVQAAPGTTRSCIGCHEYKFGATSGPAPVEHLAREPRRLRPEAWGSGYVDYPSMVQPVLDRHCVRCHGGQEGIAGGLDLSGGWTEHFNISYENLVNRRETQLVAYWIAGIDCMNGTALWSSQIFPPRSHGSGAAPLADLLVKGHDERLKDLSRAERDLLLAWIDTNGLYHGSWDYTRSGCAIGDWGEIRGSVSEALAKAHCTRCHSLVENDWINLRQPELSRVLRAPMAAGQDGVGLGLCRDRVVDPKKPRLRLLWNGYAHAVQPPEKFPREPIAAHDTSGPAVVSLASTADANYRAILDAIRSGRRRALANPRVDMPGAVVVAGACRTFNPPPLPDPLPKLQATVQPDGAVTLSWERSARTIGLAAELHRAAQPQFTPGEATLLSDSTLGQFVDADAPVGRQHYALVFLSGKQRSQPAYAALDVPPPRPPAAPSELRAVPGSYTVKLQWEPASDDPTIAYHVYRGRHGNAPRERLTEQPIRATTFADATAAVGVTSSYAVRAVSRRGLESPASPTVAAAATVVYGPVFAATFAGPAQATLDGGAALPGILRPPARLAGGLLELRQGGTISFPNRTEFGLQQPLSLECWVWFDRKSPMPIVASCGHWRTAGWFLQWIGGRWRWHVGGVDCDGGAPALGRWMHVVGTYDGRDTLRVFQDGRQVAQSQGPINRTAWPGELRIGQYSDVKPEFQVLGLISGVRLFHRVLDLGEIASDEARPQAPPPLPPGAGLGEGKR